MTFELFFERFETFLGISGSIDKLREQILKLAIQGTLVPQDQEDAPVSLLIDDITTHMKSLGRGREVTQRSEKVLPETLRASRLTLPPSWAWTRLGQLVINRDRERIPVSREDRSNRAKIYDYYGASGIIDKIDGYIFDKPLLLVAEDGANLINRSTPVAFVARGQYWVNNHAHVLDCISEDMLNYLALHLNAMSLKDYVTGSAQPKMNQARMNSIPIALPPLSEQKRIVDKVEELMSLCDRVEAQQQECDTRRAALARSSVARFADAPTPANLEFLFHKSYDIEPADLRKTILSLAVQGKLVSQIMDDEPASILIERHGILRNKLLKNGYPNSVEYRTQMKKQKKQKLPSQLWTLPRGWAWATLMQISTLVVDCHNKTAPYSDYGIPLIRTTNIRDGKLNYKDIKYVTESTYTRWAARVNPEPGDLLITREAPMGEACIIPAGVRLCMGQRMMLVRFNPEFIIGKYILLTIYSPCMMKRVQDKPVGATVKHLRVGGVETMLIPVPPTAEQARIVTKVDQLMALVDQLESQLASSRETGKKLLDALVAELTAAGAPTPKVRA